MPEYFAVQARADNVTTNGNVTMTRFSQIPDEAVATVALPTSGLLKKSVHAVYNAGAGTVTLEVNNGNPNTAADWVPAGTLTATGILTIEDPAMLCRLVISGATGLDVNLIFLAE